MRRESSDEEEEEREEEGKGGPWRKVTKGKNGKRKSTPIISSSSSSSSTSSSEDSSTETDSSSEDEKRKRKRGSRVERNIRVESLARERLRDAAPKTDEERYGDSGAVDYHALKNRLQALSSVKGINYFDVLTEMPRWFRGAPKTLVEAFQGSTKPRKAVRKAWEELDGYYAIHIKTAEERIRPIIAKGKIGRDDVAALMELMADMRAILNEAKFAGVGTQLDKQSIIREVVMAKVPHMADKFYEKEAKRMKKDKRFKFKFHDLISEVADRAQVLKLQGKNAVKPQTAKVAVLGSGAQGSFRDVLRDSPPKQQGGLPSRPPSAQGRCRFCHESHQTETCHKLAAMSMSQRVEALKKGGFCFRCLTRGHMERECVQVQPPICKTCKMGHQSLLHNATMRAPARGPQNGNGAAAGAAGAAQGAQQAVGAQGESTTA